MKYLSLFSGIGGFELGIGEKAECVGYSEIDKYANIIYQKHFPTHKNYGDITRIDERTLPDFDLIVGGFPCQAFSTAGKRRGFNDTRGTLFFEIARILRAKQPRLFLLENVKGLLSHDNGKTFAIIIATLDELGYDLQWQVLNSKNHGVPQNRERVLIVGNLRGTPRPQVFPFTRQGNKNTTVGQSTKTTVARTLTGGGHTGGNHSGMTIIHQLPRGKNKGGNHSIAPTLTGKSYQDNNRIIQINNPTHSRERVYEVAGISPTLNTAQGGLRQPFISRQPLKFLGRNQKNIEGDYAFTVDSLNTGGVKVDSQIRRLTPLECERLQGFPDGWTEGVSDTQRYKTLGNAVTVNVVRDVVELLSTG